MVKWYIFLIWFVFEWRHVYLYILHASSCQGCVILNTDLHMYILCLSSFMIANTGISFKRKCVHNNIMVDILCSQNELFKVRETIKVVHLKCIIFIAFHAIGKYDQLLHQFWILHLMILQNWCDFCLICSYVLQGIIVLFRC